MNNLKTKKTARWIGLIPPLLLVALPFTSLASGIECTPQSYPELVKCAVVTSASNELTERQLESSRHQEAVAAQLINPEFSAESVQLSEKSETTASLLFTIELGGKRAARQAEARAEAEKTTLSSGLRKDRTKLDLILKLYRLSHLQNELAIEEESGTTFRKIATQYSHRVALSPEQTISLSIFRMAISDHQLRSSRLKSEKEGILQDLLALTNLKRNSILAHLPVRRETWPEVSAGSSVESSPHARLAAAELAAAQGLSEKAKSESWPDIKLGPSLKIQKDETLQETYWGAALSFPLPLFNLNGAGRAFGQANLSETELNLANTKRLLGAEQSRLRSVYTEAVNALKTSLGIKEAEREHGKVESYFFKGLVPSSLVIEAHRQLFELEERRNETEKSAIEALGSLYILDGSFSEVIL